MTQDKKTKFETARYIAAGVYDDSHLSTRAAYEDGFDEGAIYERARAAKLVRALKFLGQEGWFKEAREALAAYESEET